MKRHVKKAVAVRYDKEKDIAPKVTGKGQRLLAERIIEAAKNAGIHIEEDPDLVNVLFKLEILEEIPEFLYSVVAEILAHVYLLKKKWDIEKGYEKKQ